MFASSRSLAAYRHFRPSPDHSAQRFFVIPQSSATYPWICFRKPKEKTKTTPLIDSAVDFSIGKKTKSSTNRKTKITVETLI